MTKKIKLSDIDSAVTCINSKSAISSDTCGVAYIGSNTIISWDKSTGEDFTTFVLVKKDEDGSLEALDYNCVRD